MLYKSILLSHILVLGVWLVYKECPLSEFQPYILTQSYPYNTFQHITLSALPAIHRQYRPLCTKLHTRQFKMAATAAATSAIGFVPLGATPYKSRCSRINCSKVQCVRSSMSSAGFQADNKLMKMGLAPTANEQFAYKGFKGRNCDGRRPRTLGISYSVGAEIARIVPLMSGLVLMGIAIGFVLLRVEAFVEESQE